MEKLINKKQLLSNTIQTLRFPLAICVLFIHICPNVTNLIDTDIDIFSAKGLYNVIGITFSHVLTHIAVPCFFIISGLLFFINFKEWNRNTYKNKLKSRLKTLLIPYILWNLTAWILRLLQLIINGFKDHSFENLIDFINKYNINILYSCHNWDLKKINWLGNNLFMTSPYDLPLWFLRDLIVMVILTPVIYYLIRKLNLWFIVILFIAYISRIWTVIPGLSINACFFFSLGAFFSLKNINIISVGEKYNYIIIPLSFVLLIASVIYDGNNTIIGQNIYPFFIITAVFATFYITSIIVMQYNIIPNKTLISSCFIIYAFHTVYIPLVGTPIHLSNKILNYVIPDTPVITYIISPFLTATICIIIMLIGKKLLPNITKLYTGNR